MFGPRPEWSGFTFNQRISIFGLIACFGRNSKSISFKDMICWGANITGVAWSWSLQKVKRWVCQWSFLESLSNLLETNWHRQLKFMRAFFFRLMECKSNTKLCDLCNRLFNRTASHSHMSWNFLLATLQNISKDFFIEQRTNSHQPQIRRCLICALTACKKNI